MKTDLQNTTKATGDQKEAHREVTSSGLFEETFSLSAAWDCRQPQTENKGKAGTLIFQTTSLNKSLSGLQVPVDFLLLLKAEPFVFQVPAARGEHGDGLLRSRAATTEIGAADPACLLRESLTVFVCLHPADSKYQRAGSTRSSLRECLYNSGLSNCSHL